MPVVVLVILLKLHIGRLTVFKPMLAPNDDPLKTADFFERLRFPLLCSPKLDGIRMLTIDNKCISRSGKELPNSELNGLFSRFALLDGELIAGLPSEADVYNKTQSVVMSKDKPADDLTYFVFDITDGQLCNMPFIERLEIARKRVLEADTRGIAFVAHNLCETIDDVLEYEAQALQIGYEGIMMRDPLGKYKHGRGTFNEGLIYKLKRFQDDEAVVIDFIEQTHNTNPSFKDELGKTKRSSSKEGQEAANTLGAFLVEYQGTKLEIPCGSLKHAERQYIWDNKSKFLFKELKFRHFPHGKKDRPRMPRFSGWRDPIDK